MLEENTKNEAAARKRHYKLLNWYVHVDQITDYFSKICKHAKEERYFENLYVLRDDDNRMVQLFAGQHPIGISEVKRDVSGCIVGHRLHSEHGAALVISQSALGTVAVILYPYESAKTKRSVDHIIWTVFDDPTRITNSVLRSAVSDLMRYIRVSSALFSENWRDRLRIQYLEYRGKRYKDGRSGAHLFFSHWFWILLGALGSLASIYSVM